MPPRYVAYYPQVEQDFADLRGMERALQSYIDTFAELDYHTSLAENMYRLRRWTPEQYRTYMQRLDDIAEERLLSPEDTTEFSVQYLDTVQRLRSHGASFRPRFPMLAEMDPREIYHFLRTYEPPQEPVIIDDEHILLPPNEE